MNDSKKYIANWNNYPIIRAIENSYADADELATLFKKFDHLIARGNGRCYGDASLSDNIISTLKCKYITYFDHKTGIIECESGILFKNLIDFLIPHGWFLPVTPGTQYITLGGAVASDVHGKNHHKEGSFSQHVLSLHIMIENGEILQIDKDNYSDLFEATIGGMGLTGIILSVKFKLKKIETAYITQQQIKAKNLDQVIDLFYTYKDHTYTMAWIDCLKTGKNQGRSIMFAGEHSIVAELPKKKQSQPLFIQHKKKLTVPFNVPSFLLNKFTVKTFNELYYSTHPNRRNQIIEFEHFFYPLDNLLEWSRMYGKSGFIQYQFVIPLADNKKGLKKILSKINEKGWGSFLAVLKLFGPQKSLISFPMEGLTLALDFPIRKGLFDFLDELDLIVEAHGGRIYLSKDARMNKNTFIKSYPNYEKFIQTIQKYNPNKKFNSLLSKRILD